jgi:hypothetical protein
MALQAFQWEKHVYGGVDKAICGTDNALPLESGYN